MKSKPLHLRTYAEQERYMKRNRITGLAAAFAMTKWRKAVEAHKLNPEKLCPTSSK